MKYRPHESETEQPLSSTAVSARDTSARRSVATDFRALRAGADARTQQVQHRSGTDYLIDILIPLMIFVLMYSVVFYLLNVRFIYTESFDANLRWTVLFFLVGIVALNRLVASEGSEESILYIIGLGGAAALYTLAFTTQVGSISRDFMGTHPWLATGFNSLVVIILWWVTNRLMHECCLDENPTAGDVGILRGTARRVQQAIASNPETMRRKKRQTEPMIMTREIEAFDPTEWQPTPDKPHGMETLDASQPLHKRHPGISVLYFSIPAMVIFAVGLPVIQQGGETMVRRGWFYVVCYIIATLALLMLTSLGGLREYFRARKTAIPGALGWFWLGLGSLMIAAVIVVAAQLPMPELPPIAEIDEHRTDYWTRTSEFELLVKPDNAVEMLDKSLFVERIGQIVLVCFMLFLIYGLLKGIGHAAAALARKRDRMPQIVARFFDWLDRLVQHITQMPAPRIRKRRLRVPRQAATCTSYRNTLSDSTRQNGDLRAQIQYAYDALCALGYDLGVPRREGQTPYEYAAALPPELKGLRSEAAELTDIYVRSAYSNAPLDPRLEDRLRKFWFEYERLRRRILH